LVPSNFVRFKLRFIDGAIQPAIGPDAINSP